MVGGTYWWNPSTFSDVYEYVPQKICCSFSKTMGKNLIKFERSSVGGGVTLNGRQLYDDGILEIDRIEEEVQLKYQLPDDFL